MRRFFKILLLHFQHIPQHRARSFVWFLLSLFNPLLLLMFWMAAIQSDVKTAQHISLSSITSYYFLLTVINSTLMSHVADNVTNDIQKGNLSRYLLRPFSYISFMFCEEIHYRLLQGLYGVLTLGVLTLIFGKFITISSDPLTLILWIFMAIFAFAITFMFNMLIGLLTFWFTEVWSFYQFIEMLIIIFAGFTMPIDLFPDWLFSLSKMLPFAYMIYYPVIALQGSLSYIEMGTIILIQLAWIGFFSVLYQYFWSKGIREFTAVGQ